MRLASLALATVAASLLFGGCSAAEPSRTGNPASVGQAGPMTEFLVLSADDGRQQLVAADQADVARQHGYTTVEFTTHASTRGLARAAWDAHRGGMQLGDESEITNAWGLESLTDAQRESVVELVQTLVSKDRTSLERFGAYAYGDPYQWTKPYGRWDEVELRMPPGDPAHWGGGVETDASNPGWAYVIVDMWTRQEGPSDLSLEVELERTAAGDAVASFRELHVM
jgi:hypothetical protein